MHEFFSFAYTAHPPCSAFYKALHSWSPDHAGLGRAATCPFLTTDHRSVVGRGHACHALHALHIFARTHCLALGFHGGSTHLLLQAHPCPGSSATFSNPGKKNCGRFGLALFFWVVLFGFKLGAVQLALTYLYLFMNFHIFISLYFYTFISLYLSVCIPFSYISLYLYVFVPLCCMSLHGVFYIRVRSWELMLWCCGPFAMCVCVCLGFAFCVFA